MDATIVAAIIVSVPATAAVIVSLINRSSIKSLHILVNSRMTELLEASGKAREAKGRREGIESK